MKKILFILGVGRSGTSMLQSMLHTHSKINFIPEAQFIKRYMPNETIQKKIERGGIKKFEELVSKDDYILKSSISIDKWLEPYKKNEKAFKLSDVFFDYVELDVVAKNKEIGGEKDARNIDFIKSIKKNFPDAKIILMYRDPRDTVLSKTKSSWSAHRSYWQHALLGNAQLYWGLKRGSKFFGKNFTTIKYEKLLINPNEELIRICDFLEISFEEQMLKFHENAKDLFLEKREMQYKHNNFKPLLKNNFNKWEKELEPYKIALIQATNKSLMRRMGYTLKKQNITLKQSIITFGMGLVSFLFKYFYLCLVRYQVYKLQK